MLPLSTHDPTSGASSMPAEPLTSPEREEIRAGIERHEPLTSIAERLGRHRCTVSAEVARNGGRDHYRAVAAQERADACRARCSAGVVAIGVVVPPRSPTSCLVGTGVACPPGVASLG